MGAALFRQRVRHILGPHPLVELLGGQIAERGILETEILAIGQQRNLRGFFIAMRGLSAVTSMSELSRCRLMRLTFGSMPRAQRSLNERMASARRCADWSTLCSMIGL